MRRVDAFARDLVANRASRAIGARAADQRDLTSAAPPSVDRKIERDAPDGLDTQVEVAIAGTFTN